MPLTHHIVTALNLTQVAYCFPHEHIYVSLLGYLVPHHHLLIQLTHLLHVHLRVCSRVLLHGKRKEEVWSSGVWLCTSTPLSMKTSDIVFLMCMKTNERNCFNFVYDRMDQHTSLSNRQDNESSWVIMKLLVHWQNHTYYP